MADPKNKPVYRPWVAMRVNTSDKVSERVRRIYKGISVCPEWQDYATFEDWAMRNGWQKGLVLTRRDKKGDFCPENCFWTTREAANGYHTTVRRLSDGRSVRDIMGRDCLGQEDDYRRHRLVAGRVFRYNWELPLAFGKDVQKQRSKGNGRGRNGEKPLYYSWISMRRKCRERHLSMCVKWQDYEVYREWALSHGWRKGLYLLRRDRFAEYSPDSCFFGTLKDVHRLRSQQLQN